MSSEQGNNDGSRREFLKKASAVAWVVPTLQVVNMASAGAQTTGSMVTTTPPPSTTTTTTTTTTQPPGGCQHFRVCRIKANWTGDGWQWDAGVGANDCIRNGDWEQCLGTQIGAEISGNNEQATVTVLEGCEILQAAHKAGQECLSGSISADMRSATFTANPQGISHVELVVRCCIDDF